MRISAAILVCCGLAVSNLAAAQSGGGGGGGGSGGSSGGASSGGAASGASGAGGAAGGRGGRGRGLGDEGALTPSSCGPVFPAARSAGSGAGSQSLSSPTTP